jgi:hypothetical protein
MKVDEEQKQKLREMVMFGRMLNVLDKMEWASMEPQGFYQCPCCHGLKPEKLGLENARELVGHSEDCELFNILVASNRRQRLAHGRW